MCSQLQQSFLNAIRADAAKHAGLPVQSEGICPVTKTPSKKEWTRPELVRLGSIADVAGVPGLKYEGAQYNKS